MQSNTLAAQISRIVADFEARQNVRLPYTLTPDADYSAYREAQKEMFGAWRDAQLPQSRETMIFLITQILHVHITSRTQLTPREMKLVTAAVRGGYFEVPVAA